MIPGPVFCNRPKHLENSRKLTLRRGFRAASAPFQARPDCGNAAPSISRTALAPVAGRPGSMMTRCDSRARSELAHLLADLADGLLLQLTDAFARQVVLVADLLQRELVLVIEAE